MKKVLHKSEMRGHTDIGWLNSYHSFSFSNYYDPERTNFGALRVLNDDAVAQGMGFGKHPHRDMEIISIPLEGDLEHQDSLGNMHVISKNDIQVMSAGKGIMHSEYNRNKDKETKFLQIWVVPNKKGVEPRYDQITLKPEDKEKSIVQILSPNPHDEGVWVHQNAWFYLANLNPSKKLDYQLKKEGNGVYVFVLKGEVIVEGEKLSKRDGLGVWETNQLSIEASSDSEVLLMEVPMGI